MKNKTRLMAFAIPDELATEMLKIGEKIGTRDFGVIITQSLAVMECVLDADPEMANNVKNHIREMKSSMN